MLFNFNTVASFLAFSGLASAAALRQKREALDTTLYAYGTNITGLHVFYIDNLAYIGDAIPDFADVASNITLATDTSDSTTPWTITANSTSNSSSIDGASLYIVPTSGSSEQVGFVASNGTAPTGAVTTGFTWFGTQVAYVASEADIKMQFWASATNTTGLWKLVWNADGALIDNSTPVSVKRTAPIVLDQAQTLAG